MRPRTQPSARDHAFVSWTLRHGRLLWALALLLAIPAIWRTERLYAHLRSDLEELLPRSAPSVKALKELRDRSPGLTFLSVVAQVPDARDLGAAEQFLDQLKEQVRSYPKELVRDVRVDNRAEQAFLREHAPLYVDLGDLREVRQRLEARRDYEVARASGTLIDDEDPPPSTDLGDIEAKYRQRLGRQTEPRFTSAEAKATVLVIEARDFTTGSPELRQLLEWVKTDAAALKPDSWVHGMRVGYASDVAINVEEMDALRQDLSVSSILVVAGVVAVILLYYRWWKAVPVLVLPLFLAIAYTFSLASLPPISIHELNSNTAFLCSIIAGNGINFGIVLLARYREARLRGCPVETALVEAVWGARPGTIAAAAAAGAAYGSLIVTQFRGFRQFGFIGGIGMLASWATAFVLMPPLIRWLDDGRPLVNRNRARGAIMHRVVRVVRAGAWALVVVSALLAVGSLREVSRFNHSMLEHDFGQLRRADTWTRGAGYWGRLMDDVLGRCLSPTAILCDSDQQARPMEQLLRDSIGDGALKSMVASVVGIDDVLPTHQPEKIAEAKRIRELLTPRVRSELSADKLRTLDGMLGDQELHPIAVNDIPRGLLTGLEETDGAVGRTLLVYPEASDALWHADRMRRFVGTLRAFASARSQPGEEPVRIAGQVPLSEDIVRQIERDAPIAMVVSLLGVLGIVILVVRNRRAVVWVIGSLLLGVLWMAGATLALGIKINFANFIAFPITLGIGVDYAVNVVTRYHQDAERDITGAVMSTGGAVALCSLTTIIGYSSLLFAQNRALYWFGMLAVMGELACLAAAIVVLPASLVLAKRWRVRTLAGSDSSLPHEISGVHREA